MHWPLEKFDCRPAASDDAVGEFERAFGRKLPSDYVAFLKICNGGEGSIGKAYARFWSTHEILPMNKAYQVEPNVPGLLAFGTDGGGSAFAFDTRQTPWTVVVFEFSVMQFKDVFSAGRSFSDFIARLQRSGLSPIFSPDASSAISESGRNLHDAPWQHHPPGPMITRYFDQFAYRRGGVFTREALLASLTRVSERGPQVCELEGRNGCVLALGIAQSCGCAEFRSAETGVPIYAAVAGCSVREDPGFSVRVGSMAITMQARYRLSLETVKSIAAHFYDTESMDPAVEWEAISASLFSESDGDAVED